MLKLLLLVMALPLFAQEDHSGKDAMNDISYKTYKDFSEKWELVTIRFRKDTGEMRLTYGNQLAMKTLKAGKTDYPDGAVFAKTGIHTGADPQFESSVVPRGIRRYQFMVKNKKKYSTTGGWGYGLFDANGKTFPEHPKATQDACYACHTIVENRGDVFSEPFDFVKNTQFLKPGKGKPLTGIEFTSVESRHLSKVVSSFLPKSVSKIRMVKNEILRKNVFQGTLDEMKPILEAEAKKTGLPALFLSKDSKRFVIAIPKKSDECMGMGTFEIVSTDLNLKPLTEKFCTHD